MKLLWLHLVGGKTLSFLLADADARLLVDTVRERWAQPEQGAPDIGVGEGAEIDTWIRVADICGLELKPALPIGDRQEEP